MALGASEKTEKVAPVFQTIKSFVRNKVYGTNFILINYTKSKKYHF